jgi:glyoxylase-like metal-dependent hydrolase (beta-lactamase superfamily II)
MRTLGSCEFELVSDGVIWMDAGGAFGLVPKALWERVLAPDALNRVPFALNCLLVRSEGKTILVDTGVGDKLSRKEWAQWDLQRPEGGLLDGLTRLGVGLGDVDIMINTHLHADHCGGNTRYENGQIVPTFPNAEYWIQRREYADASFPNERTRVTYIAANFRPLEASGQLRLLDGDTRVTSEIRTVITRGHTRAHQSIVLEAGSEQMLYLADMASFAVHFERLAWLTAYDVEPLENLETKRIWQRWALEHNALLLFEHDMQTPVGRLVERKGRLHVKREA